MMKSLFAPTLFVSLMLANGAFAQSEYNVTRGRATFRSVAQLETINGMSSAVSGSFRIDPNNLSSISGTITVQTNSFRTGIDLRDEHLRGSDWLNASAHPTATLEITGVSGASSLTVGEDTRLRITGRMTIRGQTRDVTANLRVRLNDDGTIRARAQLQLRLSDYGIEINPAVELKVNNQIRLTVDIRAGA